MFKMKLMQNFDFSYRSSNAVSNLVLSEEMYQYNSKAVIKRIE